MIKSFRVLRLRNRQVNYLWLFPLIISSFCPCLLKCCKWRIICFSFLRTQQAKCLNDDEPKSKFKMPQGLPGKIYDGDAQCVRMFGAGAKVCDIPDLKAVTIKFALNNLFLVLNRIFS